MANGNGRPRGRKTTKPAGSPATRRRPAGDRKLSPQQALRRAEVVFDRAVGLREFLAERFVRSRGPFGQLTPETFLLGALMQGIRGSEGTVDGIRDQLLSLPFSAQRRLGVVDDAGHELTYRQTDAFFNTFMKKLGATDDPALTVPEDLQRMFDRLLDGSIEPDVAAKLSSAFAIDSTDHETPASRKSWSTDPDYDTDDDDPEADALGTDGKTAAQRNREARRRALRKVNKEFPRLGLDGRNRHSKDPDAGEGWRSAKNGRPGELFLGYDLHLLVAARAIDGDEIPFLAQRMNMAPAGSHKGEAAVSMIDRAARDGIDIEEIIADRGYTTVKPERFHYPVRRLGIDIWMDLHPNQRKVETIEDGAIISIDGTLFTDALPERLRKLPPFAPFMTRAEEVALLGLYDERARYAFTRNGRPDADGYEQWVGPATRGRVICANHPHTQRRAASRRPMTDCVASEPCGCGRAITVPPDTNAKLRQPAPYGTTAWRKNYGRRAAVESYNSILHHHHSKVQRHYTRVFGLAKNAFFICMSLVGANLDRQRGWREKHRRPDPWDITGPPTTILPTKPSRAKRRTNTWDHLIPSVSPPD